VIFLFLQGECIYIRPLQASDFEELCVWYGDDQVTRFLGMKSLSMDKAKILFDQMLNDKNGVYFGIIKKGDKRIIGYVFLSQILRGRRVAREFGIVVGDKNLWGQRYGSEAAKLMLEYGFEHLKLHRIELLVLDFNERAQHMHRKLGFVEEGVQKEARLVNDKWHDVIVMAKLEKQENHLKKEGIC